MHSIRAKIAIVTLGAILTSFLALGGIGIFEIGKESDRSSIEKMTLISEKMQQTLNSYFGSIEQSVEMGIHIAVDSLSELDLTYFLSSRTPEQTEQLNRIISEHCSEVEHAFSSIANHTNGTVTYYYCINSDLNIDEHGFFWSKLDSGQFVRQPPLISSELDASDLTHTTWYYSPVKAATPVWVGPYKSHFLGEVLTISYVAPIYNQGFLIGVLGMDILLQTIIDQIAPLRIYDSGYLYLMNDTGTIVYHPFLESGSTPEDYGLNLDKELFKRSGSGKELIRYTMDGQEKQMAFSTLRNRLKLGVTVPVAEINASQYRLTAILLPVAALILAVFSLVTGLVVHTLTKPLQELAVASQRLMNGDYDADLSYDGTDELGIVTRSFRQMRDYLKLYISDLNSRVYHDALTGVKNRGAFTITVSQLNKDIRAGRQSAFAVVSFDCNNLKRINDEYGHERGDIYLQKTCRLICQVFAHSPVFRLGGDEFGVIMQETDYTNREALLRAFEESVKANNAAAANPWEKVSVAHGTAVFTPGEDQTAEQVVNRADRYMYENKKQFKEGAL